MDFERAIQTLCDGGVEFVLVGGVSATIYGSSRATYDLAICYSRKRENVRRLVGALAPLHPYPRDFPPGLPFIWDDVTLANGGLFTLVTDIGSIDLIADVAGVGTYEAAVLHSTRVSLYGREVSNLDLRALIASKLAAGRPKDIADVKELEAILEAVRLSRAKPE